MSKNLIYGCMGLGKWNRNEVDKESLKAGFEALDTALDCGIRTFDLANIYAYGQSEKIFGEYLRANTGLREEVVINSKAGIVLDATKSGGNMYNSSESYLKHEIKQILERLQTDKLDCFIIHRYDPLTSLESLAKTLDELIAQKFTNSIGLSNIPPSIFNKIQQLCQSPIVACQIQLSLGHSNLLKPSTFFNQKEESDFSPSIFEYPSGIEFQAWSPLDQGKLLKKDVIRSEMERLSLKYEASLEAVQLAWLKNIPLNIRPIIGTTNPKRIALCAQDVTLNRKEWFNLWELALNQKLP